MSRPETSSPIAHSRPWPSATSDVGGGRLRRRRPPPLPQVAAAGGTSSRAANCVSCVSCFSALATVGLESTLSPQADRQRVPRLDAYVATVRRYSATGGWPDYRIRLPDACNFLWSLCWYTFIRPVCGVVSPAPSVPAIIPASLQVQQDEGLLRPEGHKAQHRHCNHRWHRLRPLRLWYVCTRFVAPRAHAADHHKIRVSWEVF